MSGKPKCTHGRNRYECILCNARLICEHNIRKTTCMKCNPHLRCQHNTRKSQCMVCNPRLKCEHNIGRYVCMVCSPHLSCKHGRNKRTCSECNPNKKCETHNKVMCLECNPSLACPKHPQFRRYRCPVCGGPGICSHGKQKESCSQCKNDGNPGISFCKKTNVLKRDCPCETCRYNKVVRGGIVVRRGIIKNKYTRRAPPQPQAQQGAVVEQSQAPQGAVVVLSKKPEAQAQVHEEELVQGDGDGDGGWYTDYDNEGEVFINETSDEMSDEMSHGGWETEGGKRKRKRKQRFTRRLRRRNHNTKKSKIVKRKITKHSRKNKYKLK